MRYECRDLHLSDRLFGWKFRDRSRHQSTKLIYQREAIYPIKCAVWSAWFVLASLFIVFEDLRRWWLDRWLRIEFLILRLTEEPSTVELRVSPPASQMIRTFGRLTFHLIAYHSINLVTRRLRFAMPLRERFAFRLLIPRDASILPCHQEKTGEKPWTFWIQDLKSIN